MNYEQAKNLKRFKNTCNCSGFSGLNERYKLRHPHMEWCTQYKEWEEWRAVIEAGAEIMPDKGYKVGSLNDPDFLKIQAAHRKIGD